ncbi:MAG: cytidylyltransferase domain-containing protein [Dongiaceae bacterium]
MILAILQARMTSSRLPGKVMKPILGRPMLARQIERLSRSRRIDELLVATSEEPSDDPIAELCQALGIAVFRGSLSDVLDRYYRAASTRGPSHVVRLTGDCPLTDPGIVDAIIEFGLDGDYDFASNAMRRTFPVGLDASITRFRCLEEAWREAKLPPEREHVTLFLYSRPERYRLGKFVQTADRSHLHWAVDEAQDLAFVTRVYEALYPDRPIFGTQDILDLLARRPEIAGAPRAAAITA